MSDYGQEDQEPYARRIAPIAYALAPRVAVTGGAFSITLASREDIAALLGCRASLTWALGEIDRLRAAAASGEPDALTRGERAELLAWRAFESANMAAGLTRVADLDLAQRVSELRAENEAASGQAGTTSGVVADPSPALPLAGRADAETPLGHGGPLAGEAASLGLRLSAPPSAGRAARTGPDTGVWRCSCCGEMYDPETPMGAWRWAGDRWQHKCPTIEPQCGHQDACYFGPVADEPAGRAAAEPRRPSLEFAWRCMSLGYLDRAKHEIALLMDAEKRAAAEAPDMVAVRSATWPWVMAFASEMEAKLALNRHKGDRDGWVNDTAESLLERLREEVEELAAAMPMNLRVKQGDLARVIRGECADVANFAMMIADVAGGLRAAAERAADGPR